MTERDPRLKQCSKCDNWVGKSNIVGSCADCMNSKGFAVTCNCGVPGCAACWDGGVVAKILEDAEINVITTGIKHCTQCSVQIDRLSIDDHCPSCAEKSEDVPKKEMRYGWWISFLLMHRKDYTPILGNCFVAMSFDSVGEVDNFNMLAMSAYAQSGESPHTHTSTILNFKRMEDMDFEISIPKSAYSQSEEKVEEKENVVSMFGKQES